MRRCQVSQFPCPDRGTARRASEKPESFAKIIAQLYPSAPKLDNVRPQAERRLEGVGQRSRRMTDRLPLELTDEEERALIALLRRAIDEARYPLAPR